MTLSTKLFDTVSTLGPHSRKPQYDVGGRWQRVIYRGEVPRNISRAFSHTFNDLQVPYRKVSVEFDCVGSHVPGKYLR